MKRKPFDLEAAKRGEPVVTREGLPWQYGCFFPGDRGRAGGIVAGRVQGGLPGFWDSDGSLGAGEHTSDLFMAPRRMQAWARLYRGDFSPQRIAVAFAPEGQPPQRDNGRDWLGDAVKVGEPQDEGDE